MTDEQARDDQQLVDAFVDGERVDTSRLRAALRNDDAVDYLVDALALRDVVTENVPTVLHPEGVPAISTPKMERRTFRFGNRRPRFASRWLTAAAVVLAAGGGFMAGVWAPGGSPDATISDDAPAPTRVIELEPGVNWTESSGGN